MTSLNAHFVYFLSSIVIIVVQFLCLFISISSLQLIYSMFFSGAEEKAKQILKNVAEEVGQGKPERYTSLFINDFVFSAVSIVLSAFSVFIGIVINLLVRKLLGLKASEESQRLGNSLAELKALLIFFVVFLFIVLLAIAVTTLYSSSIKTFRTHVATIICVGISSGFLITIFVLTLM